MPDLNLLVILFLPDEIMESFATVNRGECGLRAQPQCLNGEQSRISNGYENIDVQVDMETW